MQLYPRAVLTKSARGYIIYTGVFVLGSAVTMIGQNSLPLLTNADAKIVYIVQKFLLYYHATT